MRFFIFISILTFSLSIHQVSNAQINALTETGEKVSLFPDGTWKYTQGKEDVISEIKMNGQKFDRNPKSDFLIKSSKFNIGVWINPKQWTFEKEKPEESAEYTFRKKGGDLYAMLIAEKVQIPLESLKDIALENAKDAAPDIKLIKEEYRMVNGKKMLMLEMAGTIQGMRFMYHGYYYSNENGTVQFIAYTGEKLMKENLTEIEMLLNGLVEL